jgi:hypothetical protein
MQEASVTSRSNIVPPLPLAKGEKIACHAVALRRREVRSHTKLNHSKGEVTRIPNMATARDNCVACPSELLSGHR